MLAPHRPQRPAIVQLFCSVWLGVILLGLILVYASIFSAIPPIRGALELSEMAAFRHWLFTLMIVLFTITLVTVTLVRIRWSVINLGVLTVHTGLVLLVLSSTWYFYTKVEGDTLLISPKIEILGPDGAPLPQTAFLPEPGQSWSVHVPAFGGTVAVEVLEVANISDPSAISAQLRFSDDNSEPQTLTVSGQTPTRLNDSLSARLVAPEPVEHFFDNELPALVVRELNNDPNHTPHIEDWQQFPIHGLPTYRERYLDLGYTLADRAGRQVPSKRITPHIPGSPIGTRWFEAWRMPIDVETAELPFDVRVTGYAPYIAGTRSEIGPGGATHNPGIEMELRLPGTGVRDWLVANDPVISLWNLPTPIEFVWEADAEQWETHFQSLAGPHELTIEVTEPPLTMTVVIQQGQEIQIPNTNYTLTVDELIPDWPLMTAGYENARSPTVLVEVRSGDQRFTRTVVQRFPHLSQDTDDSGVRHRDALLDDNLKLTYRGTPDGWMRIVAGPDRIPEAAVFDHQGAARRLTLVPGEPQAIQLATLAIQARILRVVEHVTRRAVPVVEPIETRRPNMGRFASGVRLEFTGRGELADWSESRWCLFSVYHNQDTRPIQIQPPGSDTVYEVLYSRYRRPLGATLIPQKLSVNLFPGRQNVESWRSDFFVVKADQPPKPAAAYTNQTYVVDNWTLFQSGAAQDHWSYTILGVGNRHGIVAMVIACTLITIGCMYAFYVKPILIRRLQLRSTQKAEARQKPAAPVAAQEVVEVG